MTKKKGEPRKMVFLIEKIEPSTSIFSKRHIFNAHTGLVCMYVREQ
jgi:hypothetical protein